MTQDNAHQATVHVNGEVQRVFLRAGRELAAVRDDTHYIDYIMPVQQGFYKGRRVSVDGFITQSSNTTITIHPTYVELGPDL